MKQDAGSRSVENAHQPLPRHRAGVDMSRNYPAEGTWENTKEATQKPLRACSFLKPPS